MGRLYANTMPFYVWGEHLGFCGGSRASIPKYRGTIVSVFEHNAEIPVSQLCLRFVGLVQTPSQRGFPFILFLCNGKSSASILLLHTRHMHEDPN